MKKILLMVLLATGFDDCAHQTKSCRTMGRSQCRTEKSHQSDGSRHPGTAE